MAMQKEPLIGGKYIGLLFQDYVREYSQKIWSYMVQYLYFRILKFPLNVWKDPILNQGFITGCVFNVNITYAFLLLFENWIYAQIVTSVWKMMLNQHDWLFTSIYLCMLNPYVSGNKANIDTFDTQTIRFLVD